MRRLLQFVCQRAGMAFCCFFVPLLWSNTYAAPITFGHAIELAARRATGVDFSANVARAYQINVILRESNIPEICGSSAVGYAPVLLSTPNDAWDDMGRQTLEKPSLKWLGKSSQAECRFQELAEQGPLRQAVLNAAIEYTQLAWSNLHLELLKEQNSLAVQLVNIEKMRVSAGVDNEVALIRARLLEAQTRMRAASLEGEVLDLRKDLADLVGLPEEQIEPVPESVPPLPEKQEYSGTEQTIRSLCQLKLQESLKQRTAARDAAQLVYVLAHRDATRVTGLGTATLGDQIAIRIRADEGFGAVLDAIFELQAAQFELLYATGALENWATSESPGAPKLVVGEQGGGLETQEEPSGNNSSGTGRLAARSPQSAEALSKDAVATSSPRTILVLPSGGILNVRDCRQLAAVAIGDGGGRDVTSVVKWSSSNESVAIVSTSGLITGLRSGRVIISATLAGVSRLTPITIAEASPALESEAGKCLLAH